MSFKGLSRTRTRAWIAAAVWSLAGSGFAVTFFAAGGPGTLPEDSARHLAGAGALAFGFVGWWITLLLTRRRSGGPPLTDERDLQVMARANQATLIVVLVCVFASTIALWTVYEEAGAVPVGWMWFLAYGCVILASMASAISTLLLDGRMGGNG